MQVLLHIGQHKTGTTTLQRILTQQKKELLKKGICYEPDPHAEKQISLCRLLAEEPERAMADLQRRLHKAAATADTYVISNEVFYVQPFNHRHGSWDFLADITYGEYREQRLLYLQNILKACQPYKIKVLCYLRRQDYFADAMYKQVIKINYKNSPATFLSNIDILCDYAFQYDMLSEVFGKSNIVIRPYEKNMLFGKDIIADFAHTTNIPLDIKPLNSNKSPARDILEIKFIYNKYTKGTSSSLASNILLKNIEKALKSNPQESISCYSPEERREILRRHEEGNRRLAQALGKENLFDPSIPESASWEQFPSLSQETIQRTFCTLLEQALSQSDIVSRWTFLQIELIRKTGLFDETYYRKNYLFDREEVYSPIEHYVLFGAQKLYNPNSTFNTAEYLREHPFLQTIGLNPFIHYLCSLKKLPDIPKK